MGHRKYSDITSVKTSKIPCWETLLRQGQEDSDESVYVFYQTHLNLTYEWFIRRFPFHLVRPKPSVLNFPDETTAHPSCPAPNPVGGNPCVLCWFPKGSNCGQEWWLRNCSAVRIYLLPPLNTLLNDHRGLHRRITMLGGAMGSVWSILVYYWANFCTPCYLFHKQFQHVKCIPKNTWIIQTSIFNDIICCFNV